MCWLVNEQISDHLKSFPKLRIKPIFICILHTKIGSLAYYKMVANQKITSFVYRYFFYIIILYSFLWFTFGNIAFLPISYIPFFLIGILAIIVNFCCYGLCFNYSDIPLMLFLVFISVQPLLLGSLNVNFIFFEYFKDFLMFLFYIFIYFSFSKLVGCINSSLVISFIDRAISALSLAVIIGIVRFITIDVFFSNYPFMNIVPPLKYRFMEVFLCLFGVSYSWFLYAATQKKIFGVRSLIFSLCILLSGSRTGILTLVVGFIPIMIGNNIRSATLIKKFAKATQLLPFIVILLFLLNHLSEGNMFNRIERLKELSLFINLDLETAFNEDKDLRRIVYLNGGLQMMKENPVSGVGLGNFQEKFPHTLMKKVGLSSVARPHNMYLSIGATAGCIGLTLFLLWFVAVWINLYSGLKYVDDKYERAVIKGSLWFIILLIIFFGGYETETNPIFWVIFGISTGAARNLIQNGKKRKIYMYRQSLTDSTIICAI